jgi:hypothetical protein
MHKNAFNPKTLNGNWWEDRYTDNYDTQNNSTSNTHMPNPSFNKYLPTSKTVGNNQEFARVSKQLMNNFSKIKKQTHSLLLLFKTIYCYFESQWRNWRFLEYMGFWALFWICLLMTWGFFLNLPFGFDIVRIRWRYPELAQLPKQVWDSWNLQDYCSGFFLAPWRPHWRIQASPNQVDRRRSSSSRIQRQVD